MTAGRIAELSKQKNLPTAFLREQLDLRELNGGAIGIPYFGESGEELFVRQRNPPGRERRFLQPKGTKLLPYGLNRLDAARKHGRIYLCEGESDTWTLWHCGLPALGLPGASAAKALMVEYVEGIDGVNLLPDNDDAGEQFVEGVCRRLGELGYKGRLHRLRVPAEYKDVSEWFVAAGSEVKFRDGLTAAVKDAEPLTIAGRQSPPEPEPWTPPILLNEVPAPPPFPLDVFPECLRRFAQEAAASVPCPPDYVAVPMLAFAGAAIGASRALEIKHGRTERPCLYAAIVGTPSCGKTPCRVFAARPLHEEQARLYEI
ncbi:MAG: DUF3987 domain-containing protein, partial [Gemmataceae bacterium]